MHSQNEKEDVLLQGKATMMFWFELRSVVRVGWGGLPVVGRERGTGVILEQTSYLLF